jgi:CelD/BcsL family acetyltransferase involved in cellulose biosynthesis
MVDANGAAPFLRDVAAVLARENTLLFFTLYFRDRVAAILLALRNSTTIFSYLSAFDPEHEALGLGRELLACAFEYAHRERYRWWNFLRGDEAYKFSWGAQAVPKCRLVLRRAETYTRPMP